MKRSPTGKPVAKSKDTKRLDWLQENQADVRYSMDKQAWLCVSETVAEVQYGPTARSVIDAAMKADR